MAKRVFKSYNQQQPTLLPPSLDELLPEHHQVRFINGVIDRLDISAILQTYPGGGASSYHLRLLLKILIYGYVQRIYSSRRLAKATREQIPFMWLAAGAAPDFRTINHFRRHRLPGGGVKAIFTQVMGLLVEQGLVDLTEYTLDGTVLEANARRHSAVWAKNAQRYYSSATDRIEALFDEIQQLADLEDQQYCDNDLPEVSEGAAWSPEQIQAAAERTSQALREQAGKQEVPDKDLSKAHTRLRWITDRELPKLKKYEQQQRILGGRNSYSTTDPDATFMRLKDQSPFNKLLAPGYNLQMGTQNQYILGYSLHSNAADKVNMADHLDQLEFRPDWLCADAGYGTLANFEMLAEQGITGVVKSPTNYGRPKAYSRYAMTRDPATDSYRCPEGRALVFKELRSYVIRRWKNRSRAALPEPGLQWMPRPI
ncbi:MAG: IS1182 family transposase [Balneolaceae bacterium]|nr:IS1182 family transposase [Balneolaceae bacterium]